MISWDTVAKLMDCFPDSVINKNAEFIAHAKSNTYFILKDCKNETDVKCKVLEWLSRSAYETEPYNTKRSNDAFHRFILCGVNQFLETNFTTKDMEQIYTHLGNRCNKRSLRRYRQKSLKSPKRLRSEPVAAVGPVKPEMEQETAENGTETERNEPDQEEIMPAPVENTAESEPVAAAGEKTEEKVEEGFRRLLVPVLKENGDREATLDTFFLLSVEEMKDEEKKYQRFRSERDCVKVNPEHETEWYWTRTAHRGYSYYAWYVYSSGYVSYGNAFNAYRCAPACVIGAQAIK